jgi:hypothetical protein
VDEIMKIRPTQPGDLSALAGFLTANGMPCTAEALRWKFWDSPGRIDGQGRSIVSEIGGEIVGHIGVVPTVVHVDAASRVPLTGGWFVDWMVREDLRSRGIGIFLLREAQRSFKALMTIQGSPDTQQALPALHWSAQPGLAICKLNARTGAMGAEAGLARRLVAGLARVVRYHPVTWSPPDGWTLHESQAGQQGQPWNDLDQAVGRSHQSVNGSFGWFERTGAFLRWSFMDHPAGRYCLAVARDTAGPAGYAIWRTCAGPHGRLDGRIVDLLAPWDRPEVWRWLTSIATARLAAAGATQISCLSGSRTPLGAALQANRFLPRQAVPLWISPDAAELSQPRHWHATFADSDIDTAST